MQLRLISGSEQRAKPKTCQARSQAGMKIKNTR